MDFTKEQLSEAFVKHLDSEKGLQDLNTGVYTKYSIDSDIYKTFLLYFQRRCDHSQYSGCSLIVSSSMAA